MSWSERPSGSNAQSFYPNQQEAQQKRSVHGLSILYPGHDDHEQEISVDIVAIHGPGGHAYKTWTDEATKILWLRDLLPQQIPNARVMTFGYPTESTFSATQYALSLLEDLNSLRRSTKEKSRPLIFVCHSLGGIVCKAVMLLRDTFLQTQGIIFMGTPHRSLSVADWPEVLSEPIKACTIDNNTRIDLLNDLRKSSKRIAEVSSSFEHQCANLRIISFFELKITTDLPLGKLVVTRDSAILNIPNERAIPIASDHQRMTQFTQLHSPQFRSVWQALYWIMVGEDGISGEAFPDLMHSQAEDSHYATFLKLLYVTNSEHMLDAVPRRYGGTLGWLFDHEIFRNWFEGRDSDILRLIGLPGAGKSVISRYFIEAVSGNPNGGDGPVWELRTPFVAYFFCSGRNEHHQTELSLLKTVIHQLLVQDRRLLDFVIRANDSNGRNGKFVDSLPVLRNTLKAMLGSIKLRRIFIVIDALNEMKRESWISFMSYIGDLIQFGIRSPSLWLKVLLTSRPEPKIEEPTHFERRPLKLVLLTHESVKQDVARFVRYTGTVINHANEYVLPDDLLQDITSEIILHADGIFLWASLAWQCFLGGADRGVMESRLQALRNLPSGLASLYCHILERMDQDLLSVSMEAFRWMSVTFRQITVDELETVVGLKEGQTCLSQLSLSLRPGSYVVDQLQKICPNLIRTNDRREVQFVHQSFKDFLLEGSDPKYRIRLLSAHRSVATLCLTCLAFEDLNTGRAFHEYSNRADIQDHDSVKSGDAFTNTPENFTFYRYAAQYWSHHARFWPECEKIWLGFQRLAASPSNLRYMWFYYRYSLRPRESTSYTHIKPVPALHIATFLDFQFFVRMLVATGSSPNQLDSDGNSALHSPDLNSAMCELLLRLGANPGIENKLGETPLSMALRPQYQAHAMAFATSNLLNVKASNLNGRSLLCHGVLREWMETTSIRSCVSSGITDQYEKDILEYVASMGRRSAIEIILADPGVWSTRSQQYWRKVLLLVVLQDWEDIALTVIKEVKSIDGIRDLNRKTILHWCVYNGRDRLLDAILDRKVCELNEVDANGRTALHYAAQERGYHAARRLLEEGALPAVPDGNLQTPLHVAAEHGSEAVLKLLLDRGVRIEEIDALGRTAVHWAATWDWQPIMECILQRPLSDAILTLKDRSGLIPLHLAALSGCPAIVALFLTSNLIDVNATDNNGNTPLHCAARGRSLSVLVSLLKTRGISINSVNRFKQTALDIATKTALEDLTKPLLEAGCRYSTFDPGTDNSKRYHPSTTPPQETPQTPDTLCLVTRDYFSAGA